MSAPTSYGETLERFLKKLEAMGSLKDIDRMVAEVYSAVNELYISRHDFNDIALLQREAKQLLGAMSYLAGKAARMRAEADIAEDVADSTRNALVTAYSLDPANNVTQARGLAAHDCQEDIADVRMRKMRAHEYEAITKVADKAISLIQSILRQAESEKIANRKFAP